MALPTNMDEMDKVVTANSKKFFNKGLRGFKSVGYGGIAGAMTGGMYGSIADRDKDENIRDSMIKNAAYGAMGGLMATAGYIGGKALFRRMTG